MIEDYYMRKAIMLALKGRGAVSPNPPAGAVLVKKGKIIGEGYHRVFGGPHAEANAIESSTEDVRGATLFCTLEPCCHSHKKTPPCTKRIIKEGIKKVVIGSINPNKKVNGKGIKELIDAGIEIQTGVLEDDCKTLIEMYQYYISNAKPFVAVKLASTLDGKIADATGKSNWISSVAARTKTHSLRAEFDAVFVGSGTLHKDNPSLTVRLTEGRDPFRILLDANLKVTPDYNIIKSKNPGKTIVICGDDVPVKKYDQLKHFGINLVRTHTDERGYLDIEDAFNKILKLFPIASILVEGGATLVSELLTRELVNRIYWIIAPKILGLGVNAIQNIGIKSIEDALQIHVENIEIIDNQAIFIGKPTYK